MKPNKLLQVATIFIIIAPLIYLAAVYGKLPQTIPTHFGLDGRADRTGNRFEILLIAGLFIVISLFIVLLLWNLKKIDPKRAATQSPVLLSKIAFAIATFLSVIHFFIINAINGHPQTTIQYLPVLMGLFFAVIGNFMHNVKPNYFIGIRTPWTLENELVWKKTHMLGGKLWFGGGIVIAIAGILLPPDTGIFVAAAGILIMALIITVYSYLEYKKLERQL